MGNARVHQHYVEVVATGVGNARVFQHYVEMLASATAEARIEQHYVEVLSAVAGGGIDEDASNTLSLSQSVEGTVRRDLAASNTLTLTQQANKVTDVEAESTLTLSGSATYVKYINVSSDLSVSLAHTVEVEKDIVREINQGLVLTQIAARNLYKNCPVSQTLTISQVAIGVNTKKASSDLILTQDATYTLGKKVSHELVLTQLAETEVTYNLNAHTVLIPFQTVSVSTTIRPVVEQTLTLTQSVIGYKVIPIVHVLTLLQSVDVDKVKAASSILILNHTVSFNRTFSKIVQNTLNLQQSVVVKKSYAVPANSILALEHYAKATVDHDIHVEQTLTLTQELVQRYLNESVPDNLSLSQSVVLSKRSDREVESLLNLTQSAIVSISYSRTIEQTLVFKNSREIYSGLPNNPYISIPNLQVVKISGKCLTILQSNVDVIILPCPEFNDTEAGTSKLNRKQTMSGETYIYKRTSPTNILNYAFILDKVKAEELRTFILNHNTSTLRLQNFKGELWQVVLINNPFEFNEEGRWAQPRGNKVTISLEFEGVRLN